MQQEFHTNDPARAPPARIDCKVVFGRFSARSSKKNFIVDTSNHHQPLESGKISSSTG